MPVKAKHFVVGGLVAAGFFGTAFAYWQYQKLKDMAIKVVGVVIKSFGLARVNFDLRLRFTNPTKINLTILALKCRVFINNIFITEITNAKTLVVEAEKASDLAVNIDLSPEQIAKSRLTPADLMKGIDIPIHAEVNVRVRLWKLPAFNVPYVYKTTIRQLLSEPAPEK